jgi:hypothetical protein
MNGANYTGGTPGMSMQVGMGQKFRMLVPTMIGEAPALEKLGRQVLWC